MPCVPAPMMEAADLHDQGFVAESAKQDGDGDAWITWALMITMSAEALSGPAGGHVLRGPWRQVDARPERGL